MEMNTFAPRCRIVSPLDFVAGEIANTSCDSICVNAQLAQSTKSAPVLSAPEQIP